MSAEKRYEIKRTFIEGQGHLVEEVEIGGDLDKGPLRAGMAPVKALTAADVSQELARQVCEAAGLVVVPVSFLNPEQLAELKIVPPTDPSLADQGKPGTATVIPPSHEKAHKLNVEQKIALVQKAETFDALNLLMADETRKTVIVAAEQRAEELKAQGAK